MTCSYKWSETHTSRQHYILGKILQMIGQHLSYNILLIAGCTTGIRSSGQSDVIFGIRCIFHNVIRSYKVILYLL